MTNIWLQSSKLNTVSTSTGRYMAMGCAGGLLNTTEAQLQVPWRAAGTFSNMYANISADDATPNQTVNFRKAAGNGNQTLTISGDGEYVDTTHTDVISTGDLINFRFVGGTSGSADLETIGINFSATTKTTTINKLGCNGSLNDTSLGTTYYNPLTGDLSKQTTESSAQYENRGGATLQNLYAYVSVNSLAIATVTSRKNTAAGNLTVSITSGTTGSFEDTTHTDSVVAGDLVNTALNATATTSLTLTNIALDHVATGYQTPYMIGIGTGSSVALNSNLHTALAGSQSANQVESITTVKTALAFVVSDLQELVTANTLTGTSTTKFRIASSNGNLGISYGSGVTGRVKDTTHTDSVTGTQHINSNIITASSGTALTTNNSGVLAAYAGPIFFRKTLSSIGTRVGSRQAQGW